MVKAGTYHENGKGVKALSKDIIQNTGGKVADTVAVSASGGWVFFSESLPVLAGVLTLVLLMWRIYNNYLESKLKKKELRNG
jgi:hypothetical protein